MRFSPGVCLGLLTCLLSAFIPAAPARSSQWLEVPVFFVSDRKWNQSIRDMARGEEQVNDRQHITFGEIQVPIKLDEIQAGAIDQVEIGAEPTSKSEAAELDSNLYWDLHKTNETETTLFSGSIFTQPKFKQTLQAFLASKVHSGKLVIFVHGCCVSQIEGLQQAAKLALCLGRPVIAFDWATQGRSESLPVPELNAYHRSEHTLEISQLNFIDMIDATAPQLSPYKVAVVTHSLGARLVVEYLVRRSPEIRSLIIDSVHFSRPDISLAAFLRQGSQICAPPSKIFVYGSDNDKWLNRSEVLASFSARAGNPGKLRTLFTEASQHYQNLFYIDVTDLNLGHHLPYNKIAEIDAAYSNVKATTPAR